MDDDPLVHAIRLTTGSNTSTARLVRDNISRKVVDFEQDSQDLI